MPLTINMVLHLSSYGFWFPLYDGKVTLCDEEAKRVAKEAKDDD